MDTPTIKSSIDSGNRVESVKQRATEEELSEPKADRNTRVNLPQAETKLSDSISIETTGKMDAEVGMASNNIEQSVVHPEDASQSEGIETENVQIDPSDRSTDVEMATTENKVIKSEPTEMEEETVDNSLSSEICLPTVPAIKSERNVSLCEEIAEEQKAESRAVLQISNSSLSLLAQYISSDSESNITDSEEELPRKNSDPVPRDSTSDSSDDSIEVIPNTSNYRSQQKAIVISDTETAPNGSDGENGDDSADEDARPAAPIKSRGEMLVEELPPIEELHITVREEECKPVGHVQSIVAQIVIIQSYAGVELLDLDTVLFLEKGKRPLGKIFDVIGQVAAPMYCVLFNSRQDVINKGITVGIPVYCAPQTEHTSFIILSDLMKHRGSDASWLDDIEAPEYALEYSDDEQERRARRRRGSCSSNGRQTPEGNRHPYPYRRGRGRSGYRGQRNGNSWHHNIPAAEPSQRVINPFALAAATIQAPPPPPPPSSG